MHDIVKYMITCAAVSEWESFQHSTCIFLMSSIKSCSKTIKKYPPNPCVQDAYKENHYIMQPSHSFSVFTLHPMLQLKDAMPVYFDRNCLHLTFNHTYAVNHTTVTTCMRNCQIQLTTHVKILQKTTFSCLTGREVTRQTVVQEIPGSIPGSGKEFIVVVFVFNLFVQTILFLMPFYIIFPCAKIIN